jgi:hypothetical protein
MQMQFSQQLPGPSGEVRWRPNWQIATSGFSGPAGGLNIQATVWGLNYLFTVILARRWDRMGGGGDIGAARRSKGEQGTG